MSKVENGNPSQKLGAKTFSEMYKSISEGELTGLLIDVAHEYETKEGKYKMGNITLKCENGYYMQVCNETKLRAIETLRAQMNATRSNPKITVFILPIELQDGSGIRGRVAGFSPEFD